MFCKCVSVILTFHFASKKWIHGARFVVWMRPCCPRGRLAVSRCDWNKCKRQNDARLERWNPPDPKFHQVPNLKSFQNIKTYFFSSLSLSISILYIYTQTYVLFKNIMLPYWPKDNAGLARLTKWECKEHNHPLSSLSYSAFMSWIVRWWSVVCFARQSEVGCKTVDDLDFKQTPRCAFTVLGFFFGVFMMYFLGYRCYTTFAAWMFKAGWKSVSNLAGVAWAENPGVFIRSDTCVLKL